MLRISTYDMPRAVASHSLMGADHNAYKSSDRKFTETLFTVGLDPYWPHVGYGPGYATINGSMSALDGL